MIPIARPNIGREEERAVLRVLRSGMIAEGKVTAEFEGKFAKYIGTKYAVATSSGTTALQIALMATGIGPGDEVITSPFTFIASANTSIYLGAKPRFIDVNENDFNLNPDLIEKAITKKTKAILPIHLFGCPADMAKIQKIAKKHHLIVIEDACQAHGASIGIRKVGTFGLAGCFSFYATKNMTTGEGGMIVTGNKQFAEKCRLLRSHGSEIKYHHDILGFNFRMTDIEAAIGIEQLKKLPRANQIRLKNARYLNQKIKCSGIITPVIKSGQTHVFHQYTLRVTREAPISRDQLAEKLHKKGIGTGIFYPLPIYQQKAYRTFGLNRQRLAVTERLSREVISVPVHPLLTLKDLAKIAATVNAVNQS
jgi:perosamine synthetase